VEPWLQKKRELKELWVNREREHSEAGMENKVYQEKPMAQETWDKKRDQAQRGSCKVNVHVKFFGQTTTANVSLNLGGGWVC